MDNTMLPAYVRSNIIAMAPYELHKKLVNDYFVYYKGSRSAIERDKSSDKRDIDVIRENHKFLWDEDETPDAWESKLAKKYYDKLFKEYCICDLSRYKENKIALRWQIESELINGKGQFTCGSKHCSINEGLKTWEVNFAYIEQGEKKSALVKLRLCSDCSYKLNYKHRRKEVTKSDKQSLKRSKALDSDIITKRVKVPEENCETEASTSHEEKPDNEKEESNIWKLKDVLPEEKSRDDDFNEYLEHLFL